MLPQSSPGLGMDVLGQACRSDCGAQAGRRTVPRASSLRPSRRQRVDVPELADEERRLRRAEIILGGVAHDEAVAIELLADDAQVRTKRSSLARAAGRARAAAARWRRDRRDRARRRARHARSFQARCEDLVAQARRRASRQWPARSARPRRPAMPRQPIAGHPAHGRRMRVDALAAAILPRTGIGLEGKAARLTPERLEAAEQRRIAHARQPLVDEHLRRAEDDAAIGVVLQSARPPGCRRAPGPCPGSRPDRRRCARRAARS